MDCLRFDFVNQQHNVPILGPLPTGFIFDYKITIANRTSIIKLNKRNFDMSVLCWVHSVRTTSKAHHNHNP